MLRYVLLLNGLAAIGYLIQFGPDRHLLTLGCLYPLMLVAAVFQFRWATRLLKSLRGR
jgi:hypothetical protein